jgi:hypothetical protein
MAGRSLSDVSSIEYTSLTTVPIASFENNNFNITQVRQDGQLIASTPTSAQSTTSVRQQQLQHQHVVARPFYQHQHQPAGYYSHALPNQLPKTPVTTYVQQQQQQQQQQREEPKQPSLADLLPHLSSYLNMINNKDDSAPVPSSIPNTSIPTIPLPGATPSFPLTGPMTTDSEFFDWISKSDFLSHWLIEFLTTPTSLLFHDHKDSTPESELASPEFDHTPLQSFEEGDFEDTPPTHDLVTPLLEDIDLFPTNGQDAFASSNSASHSKGLDDLEGLLTMDTSPDALMTYWDYGSFGEVSGVDMSVFPGVDGGDEESEALPLMGPPTSVRFGAWEESPQAKRRRVDSGFEQEVQPTSQQQHGGETTMNPADMHVSPNPGFLDNKEKDKRAMPPPSEVPVHHLTASNTSGSANLSPKDRSLSPSINASSSTNASSTTATNGNGKKSTGRKYTGTRPNLTPAKLIPLDAPVQNRNYVLPSTTSRKAIPTAFQAKLQGPSSTSSVAGKKRARSEISEEVSLPVPTPSRTNINTTPSSNTPSEDSTPSTPAALEEAIQAKRLQNTYAARRSRARKLEYLKTLEDEVQELKEENEGLRGRVEELERVLMGVGGGGGGGPT